MQKKLRNLQRMRGLADGGDLSSVPRAEPVTLPLDEVLFSHDTVSDHFKDGRPISALTDELCLGRASLESTPELVLDVVRFEGQYWTLRNRRLYAIKQFQREVRMRFNPLFPANVRVQILDLYHGPVLFKFIDCFSTQNGGGWPEVTRGGT